MTRKALGLVSALVLAAAMGLSACSTTTGGSAMTPPAIAPAPGPEAVDVHTHARPEIARVVDVALDLTADFNARTLAGTATLDILAIPGANEIVLDIRDLDIQDVRDAAGQPLRYVVGDNDPILGQPLTVYFPAFAANERRKITIRYSTRPNAAALQWLNPSQTAGGQKPYLFSQGQAILTRTWVPTQDSPGIRQTYSARITAPEDLTVVMSADHLTPNGERAANGMKTWRFRMDNPIPPI